MDFLDTLETLIRAQGESSSSAAEVLAEMGTPSASLAILDHGSISARTFSTVGDNSETVFQACSISKPVAALAVMKMVQSGKLRLDAPITKYLPAASLEMITTPSTRKLIEHITIKQLLSHTSGLSQGGFAGYTSNSSAVNLQSVLSGSAGANSRHVHLSGLPGERFSYSGGGITVLQVIMEEVTGKLLPELVRELVLEPLGMQRSFYKSPTKEDNHASAYWTGYTPCEVSYHVLPEQAAAGLWTTPTDLLKVVRALQHSLTARDDSGFLSKSLARQMLTEVSAGMALSWNAPKDPGTSFSHAGANDPGWRCYLLGYTDLNDNGALDPGSEGSGFCIMTNAAEGEFVYSKLIYAIAYLKKWADPPPVDAIPDVTIPFRTLETKVDARWAGWRGSWGDNWRIDEHDDAPAVCFQSLPAIRLLPAARPNPGSKLGDVIDLVLEGLEMMLRLTEEEGKKVVQVWHGPRYDKLTLHRPTKNA
jgi:CubicO group peptidase (beta-lactamase class C family)